MGLGHRPPGRHEHLQAFLSARLDNSPRRREVAGAYIHETHPWGTRDQKYVTFVRWYTIAAGCGHIFCLAQHQERVLMTRSSGFLQNKRYFAFTTNPWTRGPCLSVLYRVSSVEAPETLG